MATRKSSKQSKKGKKVQSVKTLVGGKHSAARP